MTVSELPATVKLKFTFTPTADRISTSCALWANPAAVTVM